MLLFLGIVISYRDAVGDRKFLTIHVIIAFVCICAFLAASTLTAERFLQTIAIKESFCYPSAAETN